MRVSEDYWEPPEQERKSARVLLGSERVDAINTETCPRCGAGPMFQCVYVQVPLPRYRQGKAMERYLQSGQPTQVPHNERVYALRARRQKEKQRARQRALQKRRAAMVPSYDLLEASRAMRQFDLAEHEKLAAWIRAFGDILVNAGEVLRVCS